MEEGDEHGHQVEGNVDCGAVAFGPGATLDVNDTAPYTPVVIPELKGLPTIANGEVHVTGTTWTGRVGESNWYLQPSKDSQGYDLAYIRSLVIIFR